MDPKPLSGLLRSKFLISILLLVIVFALAFTSKLYDVSNIKQFNTAIDRAGHERMLLNQMALFITNLKFSKNTQLKKTYLNQIKQNYDLFNNNLKLLTGQKKLYGKLITKSMQKYYFANNRSNYNQVMQHLQIIHDIIDGNSTLLALPADEFMTTLKTQTLAITQIMHIGVKTLDDAMAHAIESQINTQIYYFVLFVLVLLFITFFIYRPMERTIRTRETDLINQIEASLEKAEYTETSFSRYKVLLESAPVGITVLDVDTNKIIDVNPKACNLFRLDKEQLLGKTPDQLSPPTQPNGELSSDAAAKEIALAISQGANTFEWIHQDANQRKIPCLVNLAYLQSKNKRYIQGIISDITQQKELQKKAEAAGEAKLRFLAVMSHELKTPLNSILGYTDMLKDKTAGELNPQQQDYLNEMHKNGEQLSLLINDILEFSKLNAGSVALHLENTNIQNLLNSSINSIKGYGGIKKEIEWKINFENEDTLLNIDPSKITRVIQNILSNAFKFTPAKNASIFISTKKEAAEYVITIKDNGIGIPHDKIKDIFNPFVQADDGFSRKHSGSGLGLAICKEIIDLHGGSIRVSSEEGVGTIFSIHLPLLDNTKEA